MIDLPYSSQLTNQTRDNGRVNPFEVVPFTDGSDPTAAAVGWCMNKLICAYTC